MLDLDDASHIGGLLSCAIWVVALLPQVILNWRRRSASGLAFGLVCLWLIGDTCGLGGSFLTNQLVFQRLIAVWHWVVDFVLLSQWYFYHRSDDARIRIEDQRERQIQYEEQRIQRRRLSIEQAYHARDQHITPMSLSRDRPSFSGPRGVLLPPRLARTKSERRVEVRRGRRTWSYVGAVLLVALFLAGITLVGAKTDLFDRVLPHGKARRRQSQRLGVILAWICALLYLGSRGPQILHNYRRKSVFGLSVSLFALGLSANFFYVISVLVSPRARDEYGWDHKYIEHALPYLTTAIGASVLDCFILFQWFLWRKADDPDPQNRLEPGLARREALEAAGIVFAETPEQQSRTPSVVVGDERTPLLGNALE